MKGLPYRTHAKARLQAQIAYSADYWHTQAMKAAKDLCGIIGYEQYCRWVDTSLPEAFTWKQLYDAITEYIKSLEPLACTCFACQAADVLLADRVESIESEGDHD